MTAEITDFPKVAGAGCGLYGWDGSNWVKVSVDATGKVQLATTGGAMKYAVVVDQKAANTNGGTSPNSAYATRTLNTIVSDPDSIISLASNQITLAAGTYQVRASAPAHRPGNHKIRLYNATDNAVIQVGSSEYTLSSSSQAQTRSFLSSRFTLAATKAIQIEHFTQVSQAVNGLGIATNNGDVEIYTIVEVWKEP